MNLGALRIPLLVTSSLLGVIGVLYLASAKIILSSFAEAERQVIQRDIERVQEALLNDLATLDTEAEDYAEWDDTYAFMANRNAEYVCSNLNDATLDSLQLNLVALFDSAGQIIFSKGFDLENSQGIPFPKSLQTHLTPDSLLLQHPNLENSPSGIVLLPEGALLIASSPILTSASEGPSRGSLLMGRYLNTAQQERLADLTRVSLAIYPFNAAQLPADVQTVHSFLLNEHRQTFVQPLNPDLIAGYMLLPDIYGNLALIFRIDAPRDIYH
ncbi:MAG: CHASE4 domain-containing protein [Leptolyngbyaceae cyanobacterium MO_188.B28]|nr:CHASE4 domain-containing protein [Leptolyngbyaceae cyanobacterium MO_188.B28]